MGLSKIIILFTVYYYTSACFINANPAVDYLNTTPIETKEELYINFEDVLPSKYIKDNILFTDKHYTKQIDSILEILRNETIDKDQKYLIMNSSKVFKDFLSNKNISIENLNDLVNHYVDIKEKEGEVLNNKEFTWRIYQTSSYLGDLEIWQTINTAFHIWSTITQNKFYYSFEKKKTDFNIGFFKKEHYTSNGFKCTDFTSGVLAHAHFPETHYAGEIHFNDAQKFQKSKFESSYSLLHVAIHEIGHALGLRHNKYKTSIMYPEEPLNRHLKLNLRFFDKRDIDQFH